MENKLIIIDEEIESHNFLKQIGGSVEVLALNSIAMLSLDKLEIPFKNVDEFYSRHEFTNDCKNMFTDTENIFKKLDTVCESYFEFPYAFSGNICFFFITVRGVLATDPLRLTDPLRSPDPGVLVRGYRWPGSYG